MKISEMIVELEKIKLEKGDVQVEVPVSVYNKTYPVAYCNVDYITTSPFNRARVYISLPENMRVRELAAK